MGTIEELVELNKQGDLGEFLAERFNGERGYVYPQKDSEFMIGFASHEETPSARDIAKAVTQHYLSKGYIVEQLHSAIDCFEANIRVKGEVGWVYIIISTNFPMSPGEEHKYLRVTTLVCV